MRGPTLVLLAVVAVGCGPKGYAKPGATAQEFYTEYNACEREMRPDVSWCVGAGCLVQNVGMGGRIRRCLQAQGWEYRRGSDTFRP